MAVRIAHLLINKPDHQPAPRGGQQSRRHSLPLSIPVNGVRALRAPSRSWSTWSPCLVYVSRAGTRNV